MKHTMRPIASGAFTNLHIAACLLVLIIYEFKYSEFYAANDIGDDSFSEMPGWPSPMFRDPDTYTGM
jgi:hypothetical protein